jgi:hypothetical protein
MRTRSDMSFLAQAKCLHSLLFLTMSGGAPCLLTMQQPMQLPVEQRLVEQRATGGGLLTSPNAALGGIAWWSNTPMSVGESTGGVTRGEYPPGGSYLSQGMTPHQQAIMTPHQHAGASTTIQQQLDRMQQQLDRMERVMQVMAAMIAQQR